eukprot:TRINITY_DN8236_c0_g6_i1.p1 TRINITY_DN8236_c0_g6~~TRINITY_DN8236_c0_g6_i1.p1  ORF type:complete len:145 (-),score=12.33 TRINITY_DN8236_c0_g6_i1:218-652(-)
MITTEGEPFNEESGPTQRRPSAERAKYVEDRDAVCGITYNVTNQFVFFEFPNPSLYAVRLIVPDRQHSVGRVSTICDAIQTAVDRGVLCVAFDTIGFDGRRSNGRDGQQQHPLASGQRAGRTGLAGSAHSDLSLTFPFSSGGSP